MDVNTFNNLSDEEKAAYLTAAAQNEKTITDLTAERDSLKTENESLKTASATAAEELKKTKELNFTLARKIDTKKADPDKTLLDFIKGDY